MKTHRLSEEVKAAREAAYQRGWTDSLTAYYGVSEQPWKDKYDYLTGWWACADKRRAETRRPAIEVDSGPRIISDGGVAVQSDQLLPASPNAAQPTNRAMG